MDKGVMKYFVAWIMCGVIAFTAFTTTTKRSHTYADLLGLGILCLAGGPFTLVISLGLPVITNLNKCAINCAKD